MGSSKPNAKPSFRRAYIRPILLIYSLLGTVGTSYAVFTEKQSFIWVNNMATVALHASIFTGVALNSEKSLRYAKKIVKFFIFLYILCFLFFPVVVSSYRASGLMTVGYPKMLIESVGCFFQKPRTADQAEFDRQLDIHTKDQIFKVFNDSIIKERVEVLFQDPENRRFVLKVPNNENFKMIANANFRMNDFTNRLVFDNIFQKIKNHEMYKAGLLSGFGIELACFLTIILIYMQYEMISHLWVHSAVANPMVEQYLHF
uniref:Serpentine receptor class gamma n=1 Tax=Caenorhabditis tropicalis TaxID=1561998 RepID=A0A1I7UW24_9PELO